MFALLAKTYTNTALCEDQVKQFTIAQIYIGNVKDFFRLSNVLLR